MVGLSSWFSGGKPKPTSSAFDTNNQMTKVISGRVAKHTSVKPASPTTTSKLQQLAYTGEDEDDEDDREEDSDQATPIAKKFQVLPSVETDPDGRPQTARGLLDQLDAIEMTQKQLAARNRTPTTVSSSGSATSPTTDGTDSVYDAEDRWRQEQVYINHILNARNEYTLMPSTWRMHFRGIPLPDGLFYTQTKTKSVRPRIYAHTEKLEYRGAMALRKLIDVQARIKDIRKKQKEVHNFKGTRSARNAQKRIRDAASFADIIKQLRKPIEEGISWASQDGETSKYGNQLPSNIKIIEHRFNAVSGDPERGQIEAAMDDFCASWRARMEEIPEQERRQEPVVFGFVILKHILSIITMDASDPEAKPHIAVQLNMAERNQHQWNALAVMVTICWARDLLMATATDIPNLTIEEQDDSSDPDA